MPAPVRCGLLIVAALDPGPFSGQMISDILLEQDTSLSTAKVGGGRTCTEIVRLSDSKNEGFDPISVVPEQLIVAWKRPSRDDANRAKQFRTKLIGGRTQ
jgi:hypothetical protein